MPKAHAVSKAQLKNIIKISIGEKKKRKSRRRVRKRRDDQMDLLVALASKPHMRAVNQPDPEKEQNKLMTSSLIASNARVVEALNNLATPGYTTGYAPPPFPSAPTSPSPPPPPKEPQAPKSAKKRPFFSVPPLDLSPLQTPNSPQSIIWGEGGGAAVESTPATASDNRLQEIREYLIAHRNYIPRKKDYTIEDINRLTNENHIKDLYRETRKAVAGSGGGGAV